MTREERFSLAYDVVDFIASVERSKMPEYEKAMFTADLACDIAARCVQDDVAILYPYIDRLQEEVINTEPDKHQSNAIRLIKRLEEAHA